MNKIVDTKGKTLYTIYMGGGYVIKLVGVGKYSRETVQMKDDIKQEKYDEYVNMLSNEFSTVVKVTEDNQILEVLKGKITQDEFNLYNLNFSKEIK